MHWSELLAKTLSYLTGNFQFDVVFSVFLTFSFFFRTIEQNIAYGTDAYTKEELIKAASMANAHEFIEEFDEGYETKIGSSDCAVLLTIIAHVGQAKMEAVYLADNDNDWRWRVCCCANRN